MGSLRVRDFDLGQTLECGQFFNWRREGAGYRVQARSRSFAVRQDGDRLSFEGADPAFLRRFLALDHDPGAIRATMPRDRFLDEAFAAYGRLRLLRQDPWECLVAFLLSPVSNIPRIQRNLLDVYESTGFEPGRMQDEAGLRRLGIGFRARFLVSAAKRAGSLGGGRPLSRLDGGGTPTRAVLASEAPGAGRPSLEGILGVGDKVADCVSLFAYGDYGAFPVDTWIRRVLRELYGVRKPDRELRAWGRRRFGPWAGYAQQWLFAWSRESLGGRRAARAAC
ncbi:MAG: hypothetical protein HY927_06990 [Elusimicrobia bacterium]|nr:hypothetical protein [Elusimicrobiota bacterium]